MNILSKLLGSKPKTETKPNPEKQVEDFTTDTTTDILKDIFIDEKPPEPLKDEVSRNDNKLKEFLDINYQYKGYNDGYEFHTIETMENFKKKTRAEFRYLIEQIIADKNSEISRLKRHNINTEGLSERIQKQLNNRIAETESVIKKLEKEKELSSEDEGLIMVAVHNYKDGFIKGTEQYIIEKGLASSTGMFN